MIALASVACKKQICRVVKQICKSRLGMIEKPTEFPVAVSVITPAYNAATVLARAVASVQAQTLTDWEMIIVDDGSDDATAEIAHELAANEPRLRVFRHETGQGVAAARNTALAAAQGRYIAFLDADDEWVAPKLEQQLDMLQKQDAALSYTGFLRVSNTAEHAIQVPDRVTRAQLLYGNVICCSSVVYDRAVFGSVSMPPLRLRQDYALWLTLLAQVPAAVGVNTPLVRLHMSHGSLSANKINALWATWHMHHNYFGTGALRSAFYVAVHALRRLLRG